MLCWFVLVWLFSNSSKVDGGFNHLTGECNVSVPCFSVLLSVVCLIGGFFFFWLCLGLFIFWSGLGMALFG